MTYALRYEDRITSVGTGAVTPEGRDVVQSVNAADSSIRGVEAALSYRLSDVVNARAIFNYTRGEQKVSGSAAEPAGRIPPLNGSISLAYDASSDYELEGWVRFASNQDRLSARDVADVRIDPQGTPGWAVIGARLQKVYAQNWWFSITLDNLLDKRFRVHGSGLDAPGRNFTISARYSR
jgi:outer membrane receptor protein involved in Fe transport